MSIGTPEQILRDLTSLILDTHGVLQKKKKVHNGPTLSQNNTNSK